MKKHVCLLIASSVPALAALTASGRDHRAKPAARASATNPNYTSISRDIVFENFTVERTGMLFNGDAPCDSRFTRGGEGWCGVYISLRSDQTN